MSPAEALHTFARRYCADRFRRWTEEYSRLADAGRERLGSDYTQEAYGIFPRYNVLRAILLDVEELDSESLPPLDQLRELLLTAGLNAKTLFTGQHQNPIAQQAETNERELFIEALDAPSAVPFQEPLPYRRVLGSSEVWLLRERLKTTWGAPNGYWYPLGPKTHASLVALEIDNIDEPNLQDRIREFLRYAGIRRVYELRESGRENYCLDAGAAVFYYNGDEGFWTSDSNDWVVYCSHEQTITLGGAIARVAAP